MNAKTIASLRRKEIMAPPITDEQRASVIADHMRRGQEIVRQITWPGGGGTVTLRVLSLMERSAADAEALVHVETEVGGHDSVTTVIDLSGSLERWRAACYLARAVRSPKDDSQLFSDGAELARYVTEDEAESLLLAYIDLRRDVDPSPDELDEDAWRLIEDAIKKKDADQITGFCSRLSRGSLISLVVALAISRPDNSSGSPLPPRQRERKDREPGAANLAP